jgi:hypothetical protein
VRVRVAAGRLHGVSGSGGSAEKDGLQRCRRCCGRLSFQVGIDIISNTSYLPLSGQVVIGVVDGFAVW